MYALQECMSTGRVSLMTTEMNHCPTAEISRTVIHLLDMIEELKFFPFEMENGITVNAMLSSDQPASSFMPSAGREIALLLGHTIHHDAIIAGILKEVDNDSPKNFDLAPSTASCLEKLGRG